MAAPRPFDIAARLLDWYDRHRRALPWRAPAGETPDPYAVWLSEIMLQQTTVQAVKPYYKTFLARWPTVEALAAAPTEAVMHAWAGLGYYSRARNLHACAIVVARDHGGRFPDHEEGLRRLPGIGAYTAAAIAAIAFGRVAVVVDGNVERVMARLHAVEAPLPGAKPALARLMASATPARRTGDFAQAMMDLGATVCVPRNPACVVCPLLEGCAAARRGIQADLPKRAAKSKTRLRHGLAYALLGRDGSLVLRTRPPRGLLGGMAELPGTPWIDVHTPPASPSDLPSGQSFAGRVTHVFTHFTLLLDVIAMPASTSASLAIDLNDCRTVTPAALDLEPLSTLTKNTIALATAAGPDVSRPPRPPASHRHRMH